jgi:hypothetical protein
VVLDAVEHCEADACRHDSNIHADQGDAYTDSYGMEAANEGQLSGLRIKLLNGLNGRKAAVLHYRRLETNRAQRLGSAP